MTWQEAPPNQVQVASNIVIEMKQRERETLKQTDGNSSQVPKQKDLEKSST